MKPNCLVPGRLIEFSFDSFVEFGREKLQSHDSGAPDDFLRHAGDHVVSQLQERGRDRFHAASNAESPGDSLALIARPRLFDSLHCGDSADLSPFSASKATEAPVVASRRPWL